jgi:hypothetical protein
MPPEGRLPTPPRLLALGLAHPPLPARGLWAPAMVPIVSLSTLGSGEVGGRDTQCHEVLLLDR